MKSFPLREFEKRGHKAMEISKRFESCLTVLDDILIQQNKQNDKCKFSKFILDVCAYSEIEEEGKRVSYLSETVSRTSRQQTMLVEVLLSIKNLPITKQEFQTALEEILKLNSLCYFAVKDGASFHNDLWELRNSIENLAEILIKVRIPTKNS